MPIIATAAGPAPAGFDAGTRPVVGSAADSATLLSILTGVFTLIWTVFIAFAIIMFIIAGFQFLSARGEPGELEKARHSLIWGSIGVAVAILAFLLPFIIRGYVFG